MNNNIAELVNGLIREIATIERSYHFTDALDALKGELYTTDALMNEVVNKYFPITSNTSSALSGLSQLFAQKEVSEVANIIDNIKGIVQNTQVTKVTVAFEPNSNYLSELCSNVNKFINKSTLIDIEIDENITGGLIIIDEGNYIDMSARKLLDIYFQDKKQQITALCANKG